jgi:hypothetical protein
MSKQQPSPASLLSIIIGVLLLSCCGAVPPQAPPMEQPGSAVGISPSVQSSSTIGNTPVIAASITSISLGENTMNGILHIEYDYFQLEGIPPFPSPYLTIDARDTTWVDVQDPNRSYYERRYRTHESTPREGIERYVVRTGSGGRQEECTMYDGREECTQQPITQTLNFDGWLADFTRTGTKLLANTDDPAVVGGYVYQGKQQDVQWGEVHVFERMGTAQASDLYTDKPLRETMKIDADQHRIVELSKTIINGEETVIHSSYRLVAWAFLDPAQVPATLFTLDVQRE